MSVNKVILVGNVGRDPEVRYFEGGEAVASFSMATTERGFTNRMGVQVPERTEWHNIVAWRGLAQLAENYIRKGSQIYVEGKLRTRTYDDQAGTKQYRTEIYADVIQLLGKREGELTPLTTSNPVAATQTTTYVTSQQESAPISQVQTQSSFISETENEDLPF